MHEFMEKHIGEGSIRAEGHKIYIVVYGDYFMPAPIKSHICMSITGRIHAIGHPNFTMWNLELVTKIVTQCLCCLLSVLGLFPTMC